MNLEKLSSIILKQIRRIWTFRKILSLLLIVVALTSAATALVLTSFLINEPIDPQLTPTPSPTPTQTLTPTPTISATVHPTTTPEVSPNPNPTYIPGEKNYSSYGNVYVTGVDIYGGDLLGSQIPWGVMYVGDSKDVSFFVRSASNVPVTLWFSVTDWVPAGIQSFFHLTWDYNQTVIHPNEEILVTLTLGASSSKGFVDYLVANSVNSFNFNIHIYSTKY